MLIFKVIYWIGILLQIVIRVPFQRAYKSSAKSEQRVSRTEQVLLGLLTAALIPPLIYTFTPWLNFANYTLPTWMGWLGVLLLACALLIFARAHRDLKAYWSPSLEIFQGHSLMTEGIYHYIRHPMYASQWVFAIAQVLLLQNWLAGPSTLLVFIPFYFFRVRAEERMMMDTFGDEYREYMKTTGGVIPRL